MAGVSRFNWTDRDVAEAVRRWKAGESASQIANHFGRGVTRGAISGKLNRLGLMGLHERRSQWLTRPTKRSPAAKPAAHINPRNIVNKAASRAHDPGLPAKLETPKPPSPRHVALLKDAAVRALRFECERLEPPREGTATIVDLTERMCRWPFGDPGQADFRYCGAAKGATEGSYCPAHAHLSIDQGARRRKGVAHG